jgi:hypothetical protein
MGVEERLKSFTVSGLDWVSCQYQASAGFPSKKESPFSLKAWIYGPQNSVKLNETMRRHFLLIP